VEVVVDCVEAEGGAIGERVSPDVPIGFVVGAVLAGLFEPIVLVRGVGQHLVDDNLEAKVVGGVDKGFETVEVAKERVDGRIVGHIVAHVFLWGLEDGGQPDAIGAEVCDVGQAAGDAGKVAKAVTCAVLIRPRVDLIDYCVAPPFVHRGFPFMLCFR